MARVSDRLSAPVSTVDIPELKRELAALQARKENYEARHQLLLEDLRTKHGLMAELYVVELVTYTEVFLHDALADAARFDPDFMTASTLSARYAELGRYETIDELRGEMRSRWAQNVVDDGGPRRWVERMESWGARGYEADTVPMMELTWGMRHMLIHRGGLVSRDFAERHPSFPGQPGDRISLTINDLGPLESAAEDFARITDEFLARRVIARRGPTQKPFSGEHALETSGESPVARPAPGRAL